MFLTLLFALGACAVAIARPGGTVTGDTPAAPGDPGLAQRGAVAKNGFPSWYKDKNGVRLEPCLDADDPNCIMGALPDPNAPVTQDDVTGNFPDEFFYQAGNAGIDNVGTGTAGKFGKASLVASLEGAFFNGPPEANQQMVFARLRLKVTSGLKPNTEYTFVQPYGERKVKTDPGEDNLFVTEDIGTVAGKFDDALKGRIGPFLKWDPAVAPSAPDGYTGDPNVDHQITGGLNDYFAVIGPDVNASGLGTCGAAALARTEAFLSEDETAARADCAETNLFSLMGKKAENAGVNVTSATYSRDAGGTTIDVRADSDAGQNIIVRDPKGTSSIAPRFPSTKMIEKDDADNNGHYFAQLAATGFPATGDTEIEVVNSTDKNPQATKEVPVLDEILGATATFTAKADGSGDLAVTGRSSDTTAALQIDDEDGAQHTVDPDTGTGPVAFTSAPETVLISSDEGGKLTVPVHVVGAPSTADLKADAGDPITAKGANVKLLGTGSTGTITSYSWTGPYPVAADGTVTVGAGDAPEVGTGVTADVTLPGTGGPRFGYQLAVNGGIAPGTKDTVVVTAGAAAGGGGGPAAPDLLTPGKARVQASAGRLMIDGTS